MTWETFNAIDEIRNFQTERERVKHVSPCILKKNSADNDKLDARIIDAMDITHVRIDVALDLTVRFTDNQSVQYYFM